MVKNGLVKIPIVEGFFFLINLVYNHLLKENIMNTFSLADIKKKILQTYIIIYIVILGVRDNLFLRIWQ